MVIRAVTHTHRQSRLVSVFLLHVFVSFQMLVSLLACLRPIFSPSNRSADTDAAANRAPAAASTTTTGGTSSLLKLQQLVCRAVPPPAVASAPAAPTAPPSAVHSSKSTVATAVSVGSVGNVGSVTASASAPASAPAPPNSLGGVSSSNKVPPPAKSQQLKGSKVRAVLFVFIVAFKLLLRCCVTVRMPQVCYFDELYCSLLLYSFFVQFYSSRSLFPSTR